MSALPPALVADPRRRVFLRAKNLKDNTLMTVRSAEYGGQIINRLPDGRVQVGSSIVTVYTDGALQFDRVEPQ